MIRNNVHEVEAERWCSDMFEIRCWDGGKVHVAFSHDCGDREAVAWVAANGHLDGTSVSDLIALTDNGPL